MDHGIQPIMYVDFVEILPRVSTAKAARDSMDAR